MVSLFALRLLDMSVDDKPFHKVPSMLQGSTNPHNLYNVLNSVKNDLIRGLSSNDDEDDSHTTVPSPLYNSPWSVTTPTSTISKNSSTSDFDAADDWDVRVGGDLEETERTDTSSNVMDTLRNHLIRLHLHLNSLTNTATYITDYYKNEHHN